MHKRNQANEHESQFTTTQRVDTQAHGTHTHTQSLTRLMVLVLLALAYYAVYKLTGAY